ncbi:MULTISPECIES: hypothetical protein [Corynebacterium]|uniref:hypothetical protein n=1 Tax=Corynebacterium TaxID=1716 RepID=UPI0003B88C58|nr:MULTISPECIES: hypothetical protein [Corynebacterium]WKS53924.1 hypothetical protein NLL48_01860 [Corynebacterium tuberculostearicum]ERS47235.1 hypothetical protein HMPREF1282_01906 [Corynebacterium sp. KPL1856]ERS47388.1 hypothetical protein HMPREF1286_01521 [Corynebacterium sp. KPL1860]ERS57497.1 hypothetical protein HMPREF1264_00411 [Corynebacterium sp. KPL1821]ERS62259.1 hypothetical protein HMPREF1260_00442 [Corynebacterium sp. KPL1817]
MSMQQRPNNPIAQRKQQVRKHSRNAVVCVVAGLGVGAVLGVLSAASFWAWMLVGAIVAVVGGGYNWLKIQKIVNENHNQY